MNYPDGYSPRREPHCGVLAVAMCAGVPFEKAWDLFAKHRGPQWRGVTNHAQRIMALAELGAKHSDTFHVPAATLRAYRTIQGSVPSDMAPRVTAATFAAKYARPGVTYMLRVGGHVLTLRDGMLADQGGIAPAAKHKSARQIVGISTIVTTN